MRNVGRKLAFVLASTNHGTMIVNRLDYRMSGPDRGIGVGYQLLEAATFHLVEVELALQLIEARERVHGDGVVAIDGGANIGVHTVEWATAMTGWGSARPPRGASRDTALRAVRAPSSGGTPGRSCGRVRRRAPASTCPRRPRPARRPPAPSSRRPWDGRRWCRGGRPGTA